MNRLLADIALLIVCILLALTLVGTYQIAAIVAAVLVVVCIVWTYRPVA